MYPFVVNLKFAEKQNLKLSSKHFIVFRQGCFCQSDLCQFSFFAGIKFVRLQYVDNHGQNVFLSMESLPTGQFSKKINLRKKPLY